MRSKSPVATLLVAALCGCAAATGQGDGDKARPFSSSSSSKLPPPVKNRERSRWRRFLQGNGVLVSDFESGTEENWAFYALDGGGGIGVSDNNVHPIFGGDYSLNAALSSNNGAGEWGGIIKTYVDGDGNPINGGPIEITGTDAFSFWFDPQNAGSRYTLEVKLLDAPDVEEFTYDCVVGAAGPCATVEGGWQRLSLPLADFVLNTAGTGDGVLTGPVRGIDMGVISLSATNVNFYVDNIAFGDPVIPTAPPVDPPTDAPTDQPTAEPVPAGNGTTPTASPVATPTEAPATDAPVAAPTEGGNGTTPTASPVAAPTDPPVTPPAEAPVEAPIEPDAPTEPPVTVPTEAPVATPTDPPVAPPTDPPVAPPTEAPVTAAPVTAAPTDIPTTAAPVTSAPTTSAPTASPVTSAPTTAAPVVDDGRIECPKAFDEPCETGTDLNCCLPSGKNGLGDHPLWRIDRGERLQSGQWLCREEYYFGLLDTGTIHTLRRDDDGRCSVLWTAEMGFVEGDYLEVTEEGNIGLFEVGGSSTPVWQVGCSMGKDSRIQMIVVREGKPDHRMVLLRTFKNKRRRLGNKRFNRKRKNNRKKGGGKKRKMERDWWVTIKGDEGVREC